MFIVGFFATIIYFLRFKRVETFIGGGGGGGGGGGCNFLLFFFFWGGGGGVGGVQILISIETYITCDFSGGNVRTTYPSLDSRMGKK